MDVARKMAVASRHHERDIEALKQIIRSYGIASANVEGKARDVAVAAATNERAVQAALRVPARAGYITVPRGAPAQPPPRKRSLTTPRQPAAKRREKKPTRRRTTAAKVAAPKLTATHQRKTWTIPEKLAAVDAVNKRGMNRVVEEMEIPRSNLQRWRKEAQKYRELVSSAADPNMARNLTRTKRRGRPPAISQEVNNKLLAFYRQLDEKDRTVFLLIEKLLQLDPNAKEVSEEILSRRIHKLKKDFKNNLTRVRRWHKKPQTGGGRADDDEDEEEDDDDASCTSSSSQTQCKRQHGKALRTKGGEMEEDEDDASSASSALPGPAFPSSSRTLQQPLGIKRHLKRKEGEQRRKETIWVVHPSHPKSNTTDTIKRHLKQKQRRKTI